MIVERTSEGKEIARAKAEAKGEKFKEGRPKKYSKAQLDHTIELRKEYSIKQASIRNDRNIRGYNKERTS